MFGQNFCISCYYLLSVTIVLEHIFMRPFKLMFWFLLCILSFSANFNVQIEFSNWNWKSERWLNVFEGNRNTDWQEIRQYLCGGAIFRMHFLLWKNPFEQITKANKFFLSKNFLFRSSLIRLWPVVGFCNC